MNEEACGVDVCLDIETIKSAPHCPHGPTLLFERYIESKKISKRFYACSASRDRKFCSFYQLADSNISNKRNSKEEFKTKDWISLPFTQDEFVERLKQMKLLDPRQRHMCRTCGLLLFQNEVKDHGGHQVLSSVTDDQLLSPTKLLQPLNNNQTNAQFLFSDRTVNVFKGIIKNINVKRVLCIGTPRLYEALVNETSSENQLKCLLLDIDQRLEQFYRPNEFCRYNMFNHHFFDGSNQDTYIRFLNDPSCLPDDLLVVIDPPFGGLVEVLAFSLRRIGRDFIDQAEGLNYLPQVMWVFPYFMESRILKALPSFFMLDYRVEYENPLKQRRKDDKNSAVVRIFTNLDPSSVVLPSREGYRLCTICKRYVSSDNRHCAKCNTCTTKAGDTYKHCELCQRCVKPSWQHCDKCNTCEIPNQHSQKDRLRGCHNCGLMDHKRENCPAKRKLTSVADSFDKSSKTKKQKRDKKLMADEKSSKRKQIT